VDYLSDETETTNLIDQNPKVADDLRNDLMNWHENYPHINDINEIENLSYVDLTLGRKN